VVVGEGVVEGELRDVRDGVVGGVRRGDREAVPQAGEGVCRIPGYVAVRQSVAPVVALAGVCRLSIIVG